MPLTQIFVPDHLPAPLAHQLARAAHQALVDTCHVPPTDLFQLIHRLPATDRVFDPHYGGVTRSERTCLIHVTLLQGRTPEQKRQLFRQMAESAHTIGIPADDIIVALQENTAMDWSLGQGMAYADVSAA